MTWINVEKSSFKPKYGRITGIGGKKAVPGRGLHLSLRDSTGIITEEWRNISVFSAEIPALGGKDSDGRAGVDASPGRADEGTEGERLPEAGTGKPSPWRGRLAKPPG